MKATQATEECSQWRAKESKLFSPKGEKTAQQRLTASSLEDVRWGLRSPGNKQDALHRSIRSIQLSGTEDESGKVHEKEAALTYAQCWIREQMKTEVKTREPQKEQILS